MIVDKEVARKSKVTEKDGARRLEKHKKDQFAAMYWELKTHTDDCATYYVQRLTLDSCKIQMFYHDWSTDPSMM